MITLEQKEFRKGKIGASSCASALGLSRWRTKANLYHEILGNITPEDIGEKGIIGNEMEPVIISAYQRRTGVHVEPFRLPRPANDPIPSDTLVHSDYPWMIAHLDGDIPDEKKILEIKNVGWTMANSWGLDGDPKGVPMDVMCQCTQQAILRGVDRVDVAAFFGGNELRVYPLEINKGSKKRVMEGLLHFWNDHVVKKVQPEVTQDDLDLLKELYWNAQNEKVIQIDSTASAIAFQDYRQTKDQIKELEEKAGKFKASIIEFMGDAGILMRGEDQEFTHKRTKDTMKVDYKAVAENFEERLIDCGQYVSDLQEVWKDNTFIKKGHRVFLDKVK